MTEKGKIGQVEIQSNQIIFTNKDNSKIYKTGLMDDPDRTERLYESGAKFSSQIVHSFTRLPAEVRFKLWKEKPSSPEAPADMIFEMKIN